MKLYHYCCRHSQRKIGRYGTLVPSPQLWGGKLVWLTDMAVPDAEGLGLTSHIQPCDRLEFRYVVDWFAFPWLESSARKVFGAKFGLPAVLQFEENRLPEHWFVSDISIPCRQDMSYGRDKEA